MTRVLYLNPATNEATVAEREWTRIDNLHGVIQMKNELDRLDPEFWKLVVRTALARPDVRLVWSFLDSVLRAESLRTENPRA